MARGNARELAREKAQKKQLEAQKKKSAAEKSSNKGLSLEERRRRDAENIKLKQQKALEAKQSSAQRAWGAQLLTTESSDRSIQLEAKSINIVKKIYPEIYK